MPLFLWKNPDRWGLTSLCPCFSEGNLIVDFTLSMFQWRKPDRWLHSVPVLVKEALSLTLFWPLLKYSHPCSTHKFCNNGSYRCGLRNLDTFNEPTTYRKLSTPTCRLCANCLYTVLYCDACLFTTRRRQIWPQSLWMTRAALEACPVTALSFKVISMQSVVLSCSQSLCRMRHCLSTDVELYTHNHKFGG